MNYTDYTDPGTVQEYWLQNIAPKYFNFNTQNLHRTGIFGYVNEVDATIESDTAHAVSVARREFYPNTAIYTKSLYKMAALQQISYPLANPAVATAILLLREDEIIKNAEFIDGKYKFVLDNSMVIGANGIPFLMDYPIVIIAKQVKTGKNILENKDGDDSIQDKIPKYAYTVRYDTQFKNDINHITSNYLVSRTVRYNGEALLLCKIGVHQCSVDVQTAEINTLQTLNNISKDFSFDGKLCNFEVFYSESEGGAVYQLKKLPLNSNAINDKFCMYSLTDNQTLRITFPENAYFTPKFNSSITVKIYTTLGSEGNFPLYKGTLLCTPNSEDYPYNNMCTIIGQIQGASIGGTDFPSQDDFRNDVIAAYATCKTITTDNDLQIHFDSVMTDTRNKVIFKKKRDDVFERLYGAYMLLKDVGGNIVPANTLTLEIPENMVDIYFDSNNKAIIKPGGVFKYQDKDNFITSEYNVYNTGFSLNTDINDNIRDFCYTNIFLIQVNRSPDLVGYYLNTVDKTIGVDLSYVNDNSYVQFNMNGFTIRRNAIHGENFYKLSVNLQPSIVSSGLDELLFIEAEDMYTVDKIPTEIRAEYSGIVEKFEFLNQSVFMVIRYTPDIPGVTRKSLTKYCQEPGMPTDRDNPDDMRIWIRISAPVQYTESESGQKIYDTPAWYNTNLQSGDTFTGGSIIATRKPRDNGLLRVIAEIKGETFGHYIPMTLENYDKDTDAYTYTAYLSTNDVMNKDGRLEIIGGFSVTDGKPKNYVSIDPTNCEVSVSTFVQYDDINYSHVYGNYDYLRDFTMTNTFVSNGETFDFVTPIKFIRSTVSYDQLHVGGGDTGEEERVEFYLRISEVPLIRSNWLKNSGNVFDIVDIINRNHEYLLQAYDLLENNYSIDMKFFNTYGKSRFFRIGIKEEPEVLYKVNIVPRFGIKLNMLSPFDEFKERFVSFVREYIESFNDVTNQGNTIYIMDLITAIQNNFSEIERLEFYGIDDYSVSSGQFIESLTDDEIHKLGFRYYIPEFINIYCDYNDNVLEPKIDITILE